MKLLKIPFRKKEVKAAEWKDVKKIAERIIKEERKYLSIMANI